MLYLYGASGHAKVIIEIAERLVVPIAGLVDDNKNLAQILDYPVSAQLPIISPSNTHSFIIAIGNNKIRKAISEKQDLNYTSLVHPNSNISTRAEIGKGTVVMAGVSINSCSRIGQHVILNTNCSIDHDCVIEDFVHISPNAALAGGVTVKEGAHIGIGACVIQGITIGKWCTIGAGAVVIKDIPDHAVVVGNPGEIIKFHDF